MIKSLFNEPEELKRLYIDEGKSLTEIGYICGVAFQTVGKWLKKHKIEARPYGTKGMSFLDKPKIKRRIKDPNAPHWRTGTKLSPDHRKKSIEAISKYWVKGNTHPSWKGGTTLDHGYRILRIDGKRIREHRYVMEQHLGRKLRKSENIHHINGNILDNRIENLMILSPEEHSRLHWRDKDEVQKKQ